MAKSDDLFETIVVAVGVAIVVGALIVGIIGLLGFLTMVAWNIVMPLLFHLPKINIWIAIAINFLLGLIKPTATYTKKK